MKTRSITLILFSFLLIFLLENCSPKAGKIVSEPEKQPASVQTAESESTGSPQNSEQDESGEAAVPDTPAAQQQEDEDPERLLEQALDTYRDALELWEKGDLDGAMSGMDLAYSCLIRVKPETESRLLEEKNDLRLMIAKRLVEIFASTQVASGENHRFIKLEENKYVNREIKRFQTVERRYFMESFHRSGKYRGMMKEELRKAGLPEELSWIPLIESGFKLRAYSRARALGLWQFISSTGYRFGLKKNRWVDERMNPRKATRAAVKYLKELHGYFGDWSTALAAYNCGEFRIQRVIRAQKINYLDNFWDLFLMLPRETSRFVPRYVATLMIVQNPKKYGFELPTPMVPGEVDTVSLQKGIRLADLDRALNLAGGTLAELNPELRHKATPDSQYELNVPRGLAQRAMEKINSISRWIPPEASYVIHYVRPGETVSGIARRYRTSSRSIARLNRLRRYLIRPGQRLKVPSRGARRTRRSAPAPVQIKNYKLETRDGKLTYTVRKGDSLYLIASAFNTSVNQIRKDNQLNGNALRVGQKIEIKVKQPQGTKPYVVQPGDTPYDIARRHRMAVKDFLRINGLSRRSQIFPGQRLWIKNAD